MDNFRIQSVHKVDGVGSDMPELEFNVGQYELDPVSRYIMMGSGITVGSQYQVIKAEDTSTGSPVCIYIPKVIIEGEVHRAVLRKDLSLGFPAQAEAMKKLDHPNILKVHGWCIVDDGFGIVAEWLDGESLESYTFRDSEELSNCIAQVADGIDYLHSQDVFHRDIKAANILIVEGKPIVCDFGSSSISAWGLSAVPQDFIPEMVSEKQFDLLRFRALIVYLTTGHRLAGFAYPSEFKRRRSVNGINDEVCKKLHGYFHFKQNSRWFEVESAGQMAEDVAKILLDR